MLSHTVVARRGERPSPFGILIAYRCNCGAEFTSASPEPECPIFREYCDGRRDGALPRKARTQAFLRRESWMTVAYWQGFKSTAGRAPMPESVRQTVAAIRGMPPEETDD